MKKKKKDESEVVQSCLFATPWTVAYQAPLSWDFPGNSTGVDCHFPLQGIFPTQGSNPGLSDCRQMLYRLTHRGSQGQYKKLCICILMLMSLRRFPGSKSMHKYLLFYSVQFSRSVVTDSLQPHELRSTPGLPVHHQLLELTQTHVH